MTFNGCGPYLMMQFRLAMALAAPVLLLTASCSENSPPPSIMDASKVASVTVGRSSRTDV